MNPKEAVGRFTTEVLRATVKTELVNPQNLALVKQHLREGGTALLFSNHFSKLDPIAYGKVVTEYVTSMDNITVLASKKHFDPARGMVNKFQHSLGEVWQTIYGIDIVQVVQTYDRAYYPDWEIFNRNALRKLLKSAKTPGHVIYIAPEGTRSRDNELHKAEDGLGLIFRMGENMIAAPIAGEHTRILPLVDTVRITAGEPFRLEDIVSSKEKDPEIITHSMMNRLAILLPKRNRGYYR